MTVKIDLELVLTFLSIIVIVVTAVLAIMRSYSKLNMTLTVIQKDIMGIKESHKSYDTDIKDLSNRMVAAEASTSSAHKRLDDHKDLDHGRKD